MIYLKKCAETYGKSGVSRNEILRTTAYELLRNALVQKGISPENQEIVRGEYGKPALKNDCRTFFNISHCSGLAMCVVTDCEVGADAENIRQFPERVMKRCFTEREMEFVRKSEIPEQSFFQLWTLKESYVKAIGTGISYPMRNAEFIIENNSITANTKEHFDFVQLIMDNEFVCSVCGSSLNNRVYSMQYVEQISLETFKK